MCANKNVLKYHNLEVFFVCFKAAAENEDMHFSVGRSQRNTLMVASYYNWTHNITNS